MSIVYSLLSILCGAWPFLFDGPAGVPLFGLAFAGAGYLCESRRDEKRKWTWVLLGIGGLAGALGTFRAFHQIL